MYPVDNPLAAHDGSTDALNCATVCCPSVVMWRSTPSSEDETGFFIAIRNPVYASATKDPDDGWSACQIVGPNPLGFSNNFDYNALKLSYIHRILTAQGWELVTPDMELRLRLMDPRPFLETP